MFLSRLSSPLGIQSLAPCICCSYHLTAILWDIQKVLLHLAIPGTLEAGKCHHLYGRVLFLQPVLLRKAGFRGGGVNLPLLAAWLLQVS